MVGTLTPVARSRFMLYLLDIFALISSSFLSNNGLAALAVVVVEDLNPILSKP